MRFYGDICKDSALEANSWSICLAHHNNRRNQMKYSSIQFVWLSLPIQSALHNSHMFWKS